VSSSPGSIRGLGISYSSQLLTARWLLRCADQLLSRHVSITISWSALLAILLLRLADRCIKLAGRLTSQPRLGFWLSSDSYGKAGEAAGGGAPVIRFTSKADSSPLQ